MMLTVHSSPSIYLADGCVHTAFLASSLPQLNQDLQRFRTTQALCFPFLVSQFLAHTSNHKTP